jgi:hypothetical protein
VYQDNSLHEILSTVRQYSSVTPPDLLSYLYDERITPSTSLLAQVKLFRQVPVRQKKLHALKVILRITFDLILSENCSGKQKISPEIIEKRYCCQSKCRLFQTRISER